MRPTSYKLYLAALCFCVIAPSLALAFTLRSLIMPGRVIEAHADIEDRSSPRRERQASTSAKVAQREPQLKAREKLSARQRRSRLR